MGRWEGDQGEVADTQLPPKEKVKTWDSMSLFRSSPLALGKRLNPTVTFALSVTSRGEDCDDACKVLAQRPACSEMLYEW